MAWHDHGNDTDEPMFWLDGLDIPLIQFLDASFVERLDEEVAAGRKARRGFSWRATEPTCSPSTTRWARQLSPIFNYPYERTARGPAIGWRGPGSTTPVMASKCATATP